MDKKLVLEVFENKKLNLPTMVLSGDNTLELFKPYLELIKVDCNSKTANTVYRAKYTALDFPFEQFQRDKQYHNTAVLAMQLVAHNKARWIKTDKEALNPEVAATNKKRQVLADNKKKQTVFWLQTLSDEEKEKFYKDNAKKRKELKDAKKTHLLDDVLPNYLR